MSDVQQPSAEQDTINIDSIKEEAKNPGVEEAKGEEKADSLDLSTIAQEAKAPESTPEYSLKVNEKDSEADKNRATNLGKIIAKYGISQEKAEELYTQISEELMVYSKARQQEIDAIYDLHHKKDPEIAGSKEAYQNTKNNIKRLYREGYITEGLHNTLKATGLNNHPEVIKFLSRYGESLKIQRPVTTKVGVTGMAEESATPSYYTKVRDYLAREKSRMN